MKTQKEKEPVTTDFKNADLTGANLQNAHVEGADFRGANLTCVNLQNAHMEGADFRGANLTCVNLQNAHMEGADLRGAILNGANMTGADIFNVLLEGAEWNSLTVWPEGFVPPQRAEGKVPTPNGDLDSRVFVAETILANLRKDIAREEDRLSSRISDLCDDIHKATLARDSVRSMSARLTAAANDDIPED